MKCVLGAGVIAGVLVVVGGLVVLSGRPQESPPVSDKQKWKRHASNPLLLGDKIRPIPRVERANVISDPSVMYDPDERKYRMWFTAGSMEGDSSQHALWLAYAESDDGVAWRVQEEPALPPGARGAWDYLNTEACTVVKIAEGPPERRYRMWYNAGAFPEEDTEKVGPFRIGAATSADGRTFRRVGKTGLVLEARDLLPHVAFEKAVAIDPEVVYANGRFHLWCTVFAWDSSGGIVAAGICTASSEDGERWSPARENPVIPGCAQATVLWNEASRRFEMWYYLDSEDEWRSYPLKEMANKNLPITLGWFHATSKDGIQWQRDDRRVFVYDLSKPNEDMGLVVHPDVILHDGTFRMYYCSWGTGNVTRGSPDKWGWALNLATWRP